MKVINIHSPADSKFKTSVKVKNRNFGKLTRFLPSIILTEETDNTITFLMAYRIWKREQTPSKTVKNPGTEGHPWYNRWGYSSFDGTAFAKLLLDRKTNQISIIEDKISSIGNSKIDMRILQVPYKPNELFATYNTFGKLNPIQRRNNYNKFDRKINCFYLLDKNVVNYNPSNNQMKNYDVSPANHKASHCTFQNHATITLNKNLKPIITQKKLVCPEHHKRVEKNISMYLDGNNQVGYHYSITPWVFFKPNCEKQIFEKSIFEKVAEYYDPSPTDYFSKNVQFSCSTPLIPYQKNCLIGAGHFKIHYDELESLPKKSPAYCFCKKLLKELKIPSFSAEYEGVIHYELIYGTFIYTVNKQTLRLEKCSNCFITFSDKPIALMFPCGLTSTKNNDFYLSYHENDIVMKMLHISLKEMRQLLVNDSSISPKDLKFQIMK